MQYRFIQIKAGREYQFRSRAANSVGDGQNSPWTEVIAIPTEEEVKRVAELAKKGGDIDRRRTSVMMPPAAQGGAPPPPQPKLD